MCRRLVGTSLTIWSSNQISPSLGSTKPATIRSVVVLPQPDGPSSVTNSPSAMSALMRSTAVVFP